MYTFQSRAAADLLMLEATAKHILQLLDKTPGEPGIITVAQIPAALETLAKAVEADEARRKALELAAQSPDAAIQCQSGCGIGRVGCHQLAPAGGSFGGHAARQPGRNKDLTWTPKK